MKREWSALIFAMVFPTIMTWFYFVILARPLAQEIPANSNFSLGNTVAQAAYAAGKVIQFSFPLIFLAVVEPKSLQPGRPRFRGMGWGVGFGLLVGFGILGLYLAGLRHWLGGLGTAAMIQGKMEEFNAASPIRYLALASFLALVHSLLEEYYWRWFVFGRLRRLVSLRVAIAFSSLAFMAHHVIVLGRFFPNAFWSAAMPFSFGIGVGGAFWAWLYNRSGSVYSPWISHLLVDAAVLAVGYDMVFSK